MKTLVEGLAAPVAPLPPPFQPPAIEHASPPKYAAGVTFEAAFAAERLRRKRRKANVGEKTVAQRDTSEQLNKEAGAAVRKKKKAGKAVAAALAQVEATTVEAVAKLKTPRKSKQAKAA